MLCRIRRRFRCAFWLWRSWRSEWFRQQGKPGLRHMIRPFRFVCTSSPGEEALTRIAPSLRSPNARCRLPAARPSATLTPITRALQRRWDDTTGGIAASIEPIQFDSLARPQAIPAGPPTTTPIMRHDRRRRGGLLSPVTSVRGVKRLGQRGRGLRPQPTLGVSATAFHCGFDARAARAQTKAFY
jgi:hypothetical protein